MPPDVSPCNSLALFQSCFSTTRPLSSLLLRSSPTHHLAFFFSPQLRSSFKQAFSKKKSPKSASSHSDIEEMTDSSLPSSPKLPHNGTSAAGHVLRNTHSNTLYVQAQHLHVSLTFKKLLHLMHETALPCARTQVVRVFGQ